MSGNIDFSIPEGLPDSAIARLLELQQEYEDGEITEKGYRKHREIVLVSAVSSIDRESIGNSSTSTRHSLTNQSPTLAEERTSSYSQEHYLTATPTTDSGSQRLSGTGTDYPTYYDENPQMDQDAVYYRNNAIPDVIEDPYANLELQRPLEPRELPDKDIESAQMSKFDNIPSILRHRGSSYSATKKAFVVLDHKGKEIGSIAWDKLASRSEKVAQMIREKSGLYRGDRVALLYQKNEIIDFTIALLGCFLAGVVAVPISANAPLKDIEHILSSSQSHLALSTDTNIKAFQKLVNAQKYQWPRGVEWWKTNEFGSYHPPKNKELPALQVPDLTYIEFQRSALGELRGVVMSHRTILHQMTCLTAILKSRSSYSRKQGKNNTTFGTENILCSLDVRQSIGLIIGILWAVYSGNLMTWLTPEAISSPGLYAHVITKHRANILLTDYASLKVATYNYQSFPHLTRNYSKRMSVDFSTIKWCLIDADTVDTEFHEVLADRWLKPLGNANARDIVAPMLTLSEHGGMVVSMRDWLEGQEKMACKLNMEPMEDEPSQTDPFDLSEIVLDKTALTANKINVIVSSLARNGIMDETKKYVRVGAFGYPLPDATLAIVNPETCTLSPEMVVGEIWIDSPSLSGGFWGLPKDTDSVFHAVCYDRQGPMDMEFLRTGLLGFIFNGKVYVLGLYEDRIRQKAEPEDNNDGDDNADQQVTSYAELQSFTGGYRYYYVPHLVHTIVRSVPRVFDASAFDIYINNEKLPVVVLESTLASTPTSLQNILSAAALTSATATTTTSTNKANQEALNELCEKCISVLYELHKIRIFCVVVTPSNSLPRITRSGRPEIGNMLCKRRFASGTLPAVFVKFGMELSLRNIPSGQDIHGGIWSPAISQIRTESLGMSEKQYSGVDFREIDIDDRTTVPLSDFKSIIHVLQWRTSHQSDELAYSTIDNRARESKGLSFQKLDQKIASVANMLKTNIKLKPGDHVLLMYTHSEDYVISVYACLLTGIIAIPVPPVDNNRVQEDAGGLMTLIKSFNVRAILVNSEAESTLKIKVVSHALKDFARQFKTNVPLHYNTQKCKTHNSNATKTFQMQPAWFARDRAAMVWVYWNADHHPTSVSLNHEAILGMCKIQKETCQMTSKKPILACVRSINGLGFLHTCFMGVYLGASTLLLSPLDYANNPATFFISLSRYKVKDTYATPQMLDHACAMMKPKGFSLADTENLMVYCEGRPRTDLVKRVRILFANTGLESTSVNMGYSHSLNPMITTRSYMSMEPIDLWLDPVALRQGYVSIVNPENCSNAVHLHDSGMVPVNTQVAIVNPETCRLCRVGEYGEIWVYSEGNCNGFYKSTDPLDIQRMKGKLADGSSDLDYMRTGDVGFLHTIVRKDNGQTVELQTLFVLGSLGQTFDVLGLEHFPVDVENTIEQSHPSIRTGGSAVFQAGGMVITVVEIYKYVSGANLVAMVPVITNSVLKEHQFVIDIVALVAKGSFPISRLGEKQRGRLIDMWVTKKLKTLGIFGVNQGEKSLNKAIVHHEIWDENGMIMSSNPVY